MDLVFSPQILMPKRSFVPDDPLNLIKNGGFERGNPPLRWLAWQTPETFERSNTQKHGGAYAAHVIDSKPSYGGFRQIQNRVAGLVYRLAVWFYIVSGGMHVLAHNGLGSSWLLISEFSELGAWTYYTVDFTETDTGALGDVIFQNNTLTVAGEFYVDDVSLKIV